MASAVGYALSATPLGGCESARNAPAAHAAPPPAAASTTAVPTASSHLAVAGALACCAALRAAVRILPDAPPSSGASAEIAALYGRGSRAAQAGQGRMQVDCAFWDVGDDGLTVEDPETRRSCSGQGSPAPRVTGIYPPIQLFRARSP